MHTCYQTLHPRHGTFAPAAIDFLLGRRYGAFDVEAGNDGFMTGFAFPEALKAIIQAKWDGDEALAWQIYQHWLPLMVFEQQPVRTR